MAPEAWQLTRLIGPVDARSLQGIGNREEGADGATTTELGGLVGGELRTRTRRCCRSRSLAPRGLLIAALRGDRRIGRSLAQRGPLIAELRGDRRRGRSLARRGPLIDRVDRLL
jgi:hypothetical protein